MLLLKIEKVNGPVLMIAVNFAFTWKEFGISHCFLAYQSCQCSVCDTSSSVNTSKQIRG